MSSDAIGVYMLDVGQGDCTFVVGPGADPEIVLFDCADAFVARRFLEDHQFKRLAAVVISHQDKDHIKGMVPLLKQFLVDGTVDTIWIDDDRKEPTDGGKKLLEYVLQLERDGLVKLQPPVRADKPATIVSGRDWKVELVLPTHPLRLQARHAGRASRPNLASIALRVSREGTAILIGGDAPLGAWEKIEGELDAALFRVPHHGGHIDEARKQWTGYNDLYSRVAAPHAVVSAGTWQPFPASGRHPVLVHAKAIRAVPGCRMRCTQLTDRCHADPLAMREEALENVGAVGFDWRHRRKDAKSEVPCSGSVLARLLSGGGLEVDPSPGSWHDGWVARLDGPLCMSRS